MPFTIGITLSFAVAWLAARYWPWPWAPTKSRIANRGELAALAALLKQ
jgi:hypothetical protein